MASTEPPESNGPEQDQLSPAKRKRLQQMFTRANQLTNQENWDYANELFTGCVTGDPGNILYLQSFLVNLKKKYNNNKKGSKAAFIKGAGARRAASKAAGQEDWNGVIKTGVDALKHNPWDTATLASMAAAVRELGHDEVELAYLKTALEANPQDPDINRLCAMALRERKRFDEAIICWHRVEQAKPGDEEAAKEIARLAVEKTIDKGGYEETDPSKKRMPGAAAQPAEMEPSQEEAAMAGLTPEQRLQREIAKNPQDVPKYVELADLYLSENRFDKAEDLFARAVETAPDDTVVRERWEDAKLRRLRHDAVKAEREAKESGSEEARERRKQTRKKLFDAELEFYEARCQRYPNNFSYKYDLGVCYQRAGKHNEAIAQFQQARNDSRRRGICMLALGRCFESIKQQPLAMKHYESAVADIPERDEDNRKQAFYLAGKLAIDLGDADKAEKHLTALAELDFTYKDVSALLEKTAKLRESQ